MTENEGTIIETESYHGPDRRTCVFHSITCGKVAELKEEVKKKVPIWVFTMAIMIVTSAIGTSVGYFLSSKDKVDEAIHKIEIALAVTMENQKKLLQYFNLRPAKEKEVDTE